MTKLLIYITIGTIWMALTMGMVLIIARIHNESIKWDRFMFMFLFKTLVWPIDIAFSMYSFKRAIKGEVTDKEMDELWDDICDN